MKKPKSIQLQPDEVAFVREQQQLINHYQRVTASLEAALFRFLEEHYPINLRRESWALDTDSGTLTRQPNETETREGKTYVETGRDPHQG